MKVSGDWVEKPATQAVFEMLERGGHQAYFVGGCVRNALLRTAVSDIDISSDATPEQVLKLAAKSRLKSIPTGIEHGTVTVISDGIPHEITTFRRDVETDGRRAVVAFSKDIREDALRRDFTMNALYADKTGKVLDPLNTGLEDLKSRQIRFIEDPAQRIKEDYLRVLRFFRFYAWYGDPQSGPEAESLAAIAENSEGISDLSAERVGAELIKLLNAPDPAPAVAAMNTAGVMLRVLPGADAKGLAVLVHQEGLVGEPPDALRRLACLGGEGVADRLRLSRAQQKRLEQLRSGIESTLTLPEISYRQGAQMAVDVALLRSVVFELPVSLERAQISHAAAATFPVSGRDLMPGLSGADLGVALTRLEQAWISSGFVLSKSQLLEML